MNKIISMIAFTHLFLASTIASAASDDLLGYWYTEDDDSIVKVELEKGKYVGNIIWLKELRYEKGDKNAGKLKSDRLNSNKKKRKRPIIGLNVLAGFSYDAGEKVWNGGTIYDPEKGKTYKCEIKFEKDPKSKTGKRLFVRGYIGIPVLGRTTYWYRTPEKDLRKFELIEASDG